MVENIIMNLLWFLFSFNGRTNRKAYLFFILAIFAVLVAIIIIVEITQSFDSENVVSVFLILVSWPTLAVHAKRWHDRNRTGWWFLLPMTPLPGPAAIAMIWIVFECAFLPGTAEENRYGPVSSHILGARGQADRNQWALIALFIGVTIVLSCFVRYRVPSLAMMPTLLVGDFILVDRTAYGVPVPFVYADVIPLRNPRRGDVIVFRYPLDPSVEYVKRVVGEPGDRIEYHDKQLYINGQLAPQSNLDYYSDNGIGAKMTGALRNTERLGEKEHFILIEKNVSDYASNCTRMMGHQVTVPNDYYFVMGDNRDHSNDSRCWGFVPRRLVRGRVSKILFNWDAARTDSPILYSRIWAPVL